jgi:SAM-dependent methyltransferase
MTTIGDADARRGRAETARAEVSRNPVWYHTIEVAPGVVTPGRIDHRESAPRLLPSDLSGLRALDVGTFDGFWAFELERRGAEVVAIDLPSFCATELPPHRRAELERRAERWGVELGRGFQIAARLLGSRVERRETVVYDLAPELVGGPVDLAFSGDILLHLRDPVRGLEAVRSALRPGGRLICFEPFSLACTLRSPRRPVAHFQALEQEFNWWYPNLATLRSWLAVAGYSRIRRLGFLRPRATPEMRRWHVAHEAVRPR